jgi:uncharacterized membrane protein
MTEKGSGGDQGWNMSARFRGALKREVPRWLDSGILPPESARALEVRYRLGELESEGGRLLAAFIFGIGGLLLGGGVLAFVAAHWATLGAAFKVVLIFSGLLGFHAAGFYLWHFRNWPRLGHALVLTGCLVYGAAIGLMAQVFNVHSEWQRGFGGWAVGALAVAWAVGSSWAGLLALGVGLVWFNGELFDYGTLWWAFPFLVAGLIVPLAFRCRSKALHFFSMVALVEAFAAIAGKEGESSPSVLMGWAAGGFLVWTWGEFTESRTPCPALAGSARVAGVVALALGAYAWSFHWLWSDWALHSGRAVGNSAEWLISVGLPLLAGIGLVAAAWLAPAADKSARRTGWVVVAACVLLLLSVVSAPGMASPYRSYDYYGGGAFSPEVALPVVLANLAAFLLAGAAVLSGLSGERRGRFWAGSLFAVLLVLSRFLEYETSLLLKSMAFLACGVLVIWGGTLFERRLRRREVAHV